MEMKHVPEELTIAELIEKEQAEFKHFTEEQEKEIVGIRKLIVDEGESLEIESLISRVEDDIRTEELEGAKLKEVKFSQSKFKDNDHPFFVHQTLIVMTFRRNTDEELKKDEQAFDAILKTDAIEAKEYALEKNKLENELELEKKDIDGLTWILRLHHEPVTQEKQDLIRTIFEYMVQTPNIDHIDIDPRLISDNVNERVKTLEYLVNESLVEFEDNPELLEKWEENANFLRKKEKQRLEEEKIDQMRKRCHERTMTQTQVRRGRILRRRYLPVEDTHSDTTVEEPYIHMWEEYYSIVNPENEEKYKAVVDRLREENIGIFLSKTAAVGQNLPKGKGVSAGQQWDVQPTRLPPISPQNTPAGQQRGVQPTRLPPNSPQKTPAGQQWGVQPTRLPPIAPLKTRARQLWGVQPTRIPPISHQKTPAGQQQGVPPNSPQKTPAGQQWAWQPTPLPPNPIKMLISRYSDS